MTLCEKHNNQSRRRVEARAVHEVVEVLIRTVSFFYPENPLT
jgi:hypothetical protein